MPAHRPFRAGGTRLGADFVAAEQLEADRAQHVDAVDHPDDRRLPVDRFEDAAGGGRGHDDIGDALDLHLRPREASAFPPYVQPDAVAQFMLTRSLHSIFNRCVMCASA